MTAAVVGILLAVFLIQMLIPAVFAVSVSADARGNTLGAALLGFFIGWIGVLVVQNMYPRAPVRGFARAGAGATARTPTEIDFPVGTLPPIRSQRFDTPSERRASGLQPLEQLAALTAAWERPDGAAPSTEPPPEAGRQCVRASCSGFRVATSELRCPACGDATQPV